MGDPAKPNESLESAEKCIREGRRDKAREILRKFVRKIPVEWKPLREDQDNLYIAFWDTTEFISYIAFMNANPTVPQKNVTWIQPSYSKALYYLAFMSVEEQDWVNAMELIDKAIALEPDNPVLLCEKALIFTNTGQHREAYEMYLKASRIRPWASPGIRAMALRGAGVALIDLGDLDAAEKMLKNSLEIEPDNQVALNELSYIQSLRKGGKPADKYELFKK